MEEKNNMLSVEEYKEKIKEKYQDIYSRMEKGELFLRDYTCVKKFKSVRRAIRRGHVTVWGEIAPHRPYKNIKTKFSREKRAIYTQINHKDKIYD